jgi:hypothetical protein
MQAWVVQRASIWVGEISRRRRWAPLFGLAGQPFWIYATATSGQLGMLIVSCAYTVIWIVGAWRQWVWRVQA